MMLECQSFQLLIPSVFAGPLPPSRRRSLYTLAVSMIMLSSKAYNIVTLVDSTKEVLTERKVRYLLNKALVSIFH
jgi:hypothetical protein